jgi:outer membrane receptor protein involved in Fe transport
MTATAASARKAAVTGRRKGPAGNLHPLLAAACSTAAALAAGLAQVSAALAAEDELVLEEILVTARKRSEALIEVPMHISAVDAQELTNRNIVTSAALYRSLAGGAIADDQLILRGLSGSNNPNPDTTNQYVDGIPLDFREVFDIERVEVLRGPQGTLWGSNGIGGTVQLITRGPQLDAVEASATLAGTQQRHASGTELRGGLSVNVPLIEERLALRVATQARRQPGRIVNVYTGAAEYHESKFLRTQLLWQPAPLTSLNFGYIYDENRSEGTSFGDASRPGYYYTTVLSENDASPWGFDVEWFEHECDPDATLAVCMVGPDPSGDVPERYRVYELIDDWSKTKQDVLSLTARHEDFFGTTATYVGSWQKKRTDALANWSRIDLGNLGRTWIIDELFDNRLTHELRLQDSSNPRFHWTVGAYFDKTWTGETPNAQWQYYDGTPEANAIFSDIYADYYLVDWEPFGVGSVADLGEYLWGDRARLYHLRYDNVWQKELAFFGEASYRVSSVAGEFEFTAGLRHFEFQDYQSYVSEGLWDGPAGDSLTEGGKEDGQRWKFSVAWLPSDNLNLYALYSEGYRPGGNNAPLAPSCEQDAFAGSYVSRYKSDSIDNYELGLKASLFDRRLRVAAAVYDIEWTGVRAEIHMPSCGFSYTTNAAKARSRGMEFESSYRVTPATTLTVNGSYTDATIRDTVEALGSTNGERMPQVPRYNAYVAVDQQFRLFGRPAFVRADLAAYGKYKTYFNAMDEDRVPGYETVNLSGRLDLTDKMVLSIHLENLLDKRYWTYRSARTRGDVSDYVYEGWGRERSVTVRMDYTFP